MNQFSAFTGHGGQLDLARRLFPHAPEPWLDLSTGVNAVAYPFPEVSAAAWSRLPTKDDLEKLAADTSGKG